MLMMKVVLGAVALAVGCVNAIDTSRLTRTTVQYQGNGCTGKAMYIFRERQNGACSTSGLAASTCTGKKLDTCSDTGAVSILDKVNAPYSVLQSMYYSTGCGYTSLAASRAFVADGNCNPMTVAGKVIYYTATCTGYAFVNFYEDSACSYKYKVSQWVLPPIMQNTTADCVNDGIYGYITTCYKKV